MSLIKAWANHFQSNVRMRGRSYQAQGRVRQLPPEPGQWVRAKVRGSQDQEHTVIIRGAGPAAQVHCTCAYFSTGQYCKHIWATLLDVHYNGMHPAVAPSGAPMSTAAAGTLGADHDAPMLAMPKARRRDPGAARPAVQEPEWVGRLTLLRSSALGTPLPAHFLASGLRQLCYLVNVRLSRQLGQPVVEIKQRQPTRTGWGPPRSWRATPQAIAELAEPLDRELAALIVGGQRIYAADQDALDVGMAASARGGDTFALTGGAWHSLLKRLAESGRALVVDDDPPSGEAGSQTFPLVWRGEEPWVLWLAGQDTGAALALHVEFRRGTEKLAVQEPELVLGGPDGLLIHRGVAGPLDDRDAFRWAQHYRQAHREQGAAAPLKVAQGEVCRFLEKLYTLASLPELDLPEGVGPLEEHATPVPHLELYSPGSGPGFEQGKDPALAAAAARNMLSARLWFAYGSHRIKPGQAGRFLPGGQQETWTANQDEKAVAPAGQAADQGPAAMDPVDLAESVEEELAAQSRRQHPEQEEDDDGWESGSESPLEEDLAGGRVSFADQNRPIIIRRDLRAEQQALSLLVSLGFRPELSNGNSADLLGSLPVKSMPLAVMELLSRGWVVTADRKIMARPGAANLSVASGMDWFELRGGITFTRGDGTLEIVPLPAILQAAKQGRTLITLGDGSQGLLPQQWLAEHGLLAGVAQVEGPVLKFRRTQAALLDSLLARQEMVQVDEVFARARQRLHRFDGIVPLEPPARFRGCLRPYQKDGLGWLAFLREFGMGGVLADDMGLGKTIQVLAMLLAQRAEAAETTPGESDARHGPWHRPSLVVAPRSVVFNWIDEARRFVPDLRVQAYTGSERGSLREAFSRHDLVVTTYGLVRRDIDELRKQPFAYVILDEAQAIKNPSSQAAKAVRLLEADHRLALTGTPVENHLGDLWSIFEYLNPGMLGGAGHFSRLLKNALQSDRRHQSAADHAPVPPATPDADDQEQALVLADGKIFQSTDVARQLGKALRPFILRRTKKQVLHDLPPKTEQTVLCEMEGAQKQMYEQLLRHYRGSLLSKTDQAGVGHHSVMVLEALLRLRQAACHPGLIDPQFADQPFAKLEALLERLEDLVEEGHKALVFSQFTSFLELVRRQLDARGLVYEYLDGQTRQRKEHVERFQTDPNCPVFLISLKAGGLGLNLTAAEYVFILDPWWNPAVENQAIDRAHRIGQQHHVFAYRLICQNTVEQRIAELQAQKRDLADAIIGQQSESLLASLTREDLDRLLS